MGRKGGRREAGRHGRRAGLGLGEEMGADHIKRRAREARAQIEDGKNGKVANRVLQSMDRAIEEKIKNGMEIARCKDCAI